MVAKAITTTDNPYDPFTEYEDWDTFDRQKGYFSSAYLARVAKIDQDMSPAVMQERINDAVEEIAHFNWLGIYKIAYKNYKD